jgi:hypothetical protein
MFEGDNYVTISLVFPAHDKVVMAYDDDAHINFPWRTDLRPKSVKVKDLRTYAAVKAMRDDMEERWAELPEDVIDFFYHLCYA